MCVFVCSSRVVPCTSWLGLRCGVVCLSWCRARPPLVELFGCVCVRACAPLAPRPPWGAVCGAGVCGCCRGWGLSPPPPLWFFFWGGRRGALGSRGLLPPNPSHSGCAFVCFLFFFSSVVCVRVFWVSLLPVGRRSRSGVASFGWVVPRCSFGWWFGRLLRCGWTVSWLSAFLAPPPPVFFWVGGFACSSLCLPWSAFSVVFQVAVGACALPGLAPAPWV